MKKFIFAIPVVGVVATVVALGVTSIKPWSWASTASKKEINYCLLIGQTDHNDSQARTAGVREALGTRGEETTNPNTESPKQGKIKFYKDTEKTQLIDTYTVNELENKTCVADSGATWDQTTALNTCNTWYSKYKDNITFIASNNDGMAEGALYSVNRPSGMPIFGYDSNPSTLNLIKDGKITGTINSNAPAQAAVINILACRILDGTYTPDKDIYSTLFQGFKILDIESKAPKGPAGDGDYVIENKYITDILGDPLIFYYTDSIHSLVVDSNIVDKNNVTDFMKSAAEQSKLIQVTGPKKSRGNYSFFQNTYSKTDTYLQSSFIPLVKEFRPTIGVENTDIKDGNGNDEDVILNAIKNCDIDKVQAFIINMTKTTSADKYIDEIYNKFSDKEKYKKTPIIFYNRQPTGSDNNPDPTYMISGEKNHYNPYVFYVGFSAKAGGYMQGELVQEWLISQVDGAKAIKVE